MSAAQATAELKVQNLVSGYRSLETYVPLLSKMLQPLEFRRMFWLSLEHDLLVLRQRSQDFADNEITITQRAFITLSAEGQSRVPSANIYLLEILGLGFVPNAESINTAIQTRVSALQHVTRPKISNAAAMGRRPQAFSNVKPRNESLFVSECSDDSPDEQPSSKADRVKDANQRAGGSMNESADDDPKLKRLFVMYHKAKKDFDDDYETNLDRTNSAKFLRDTVENCLAYLATKQCPILSGHEVPHNGEWLIELQDTLAETTAIAEHGSGGKKRPFEEDRFSVPPEQLKMRSSTEVPGPNNIVTKDSVYPAPMPIRQTPEQSIGPYPVTRSYGLTQRATNAPRNQRVPRTDRFVPYVANYRQQRIGRPQRRQSLSPSRFRVRYADQSVHHDYQQHGNTAVKEGRPFRARADTYRPMYR